MRGAEELRRGRAAAQLLGTESARTAEAVVERLLAVQAQDRRAARLALRARCPGLRAAAVDAAVQDGGPLVAGWLLRGTLHLVRRDDYPWLLALTAPTRLTASRRRLGQLGVSPEQADRAVGLVERALRDDGPLVRADLGERLSGRGIPVAGQALPHLLMLAALRGVAVVTAEATLALARDVLGAAPPTSLAGEERERALAELARRYLAGHAPATAEDLARWSGLAVRDARAGLALAGGGEGEVASGDRVVPPRLLGAFDPYMLGWRDRGFAVAPEHARAVHPGGGMLRAVATDDGLVVGDWADVADDPRFEAERADIARFTA